MAVKKKTSTKKTKKKSAVKKAVTTRPLKKTPTRKTTVRRKPVPNGGEGKQAVVKGVVRESDGTPLKDVTVIAANETPRKREPLGSIKTDQAGRYEISYTTKPKLNLRVLALGKLDEIIASSDLIANPRPIEVINLAVSTPEKEMFVRGAVRARDGSPVVGMAVVAIYERGDGREKLGEATTDAKGWYEIRYSVKPEIRLRVNAVGSDGNLVASSDLILNPDRSETVNLTIQHPSEEKIVRGVVLEATGMPVAGIRVVAVNEYDGGVTPLGEDESDGKGRYRIRYAAGKTIHLRVRAFDEKGKAVARSELIQNPGYEEDMILTLGATGRTMVVRGRVVDIDDQPQTNVVVRAFTRQLKDRVLLGEDITSTQGHYDIRYETVTDDSSIDLLVCAFKKGKEVAASPVIFGAGSIESVDLIVGEGEYLGPSLFDQMRAALSPHLGGEEFGRLGGKEIAFLARKAKIDFGAVAAFVHAHRLVEKTGVDPEVFFALFRRDLPLSLGSLLAQSSKTLTKAVDAAVEENVIPRRFKGKAGTCIGMLDDYGREHDFDDIDKQPADSLLRLLATTELENSLLTEFSARYRNHEGSLSAFWEELGKDRRFRSSKILETLRFAFQAAALTWNHIPLVKALQSERKRRVGIERIEDLTTYTAADWKRLINTTIDGQKVGVPEGITGAKPSDKVNNYVEGLMRLTERSFPTRYFAIRASKQASDPDVKRFFENLCKPPSGKPEFGGFELDKTDIDIFLEKEKEWVLRGRLKAADLSPKLKTLKRLHLVVPQVSAVMMLEKKGIRSASGMARMGREVFEAKFGNALRKLKVSPQLIHDRARQRAALALSQFMTYSRTVNRETLAVIAPPPQVGNPISNWTEMFGSLEDCECEHAWSIYSPAAYLIDLLEWLRERDANDSEMLLDVLLKRRPDLPHLQLSPENTETLVPYVDLVNEILERAVLGGEGDHLQTIGKAEELAANPQHVLDDAYAILREGDTAVYPWTLPFDRWGEELRIYLKELGVERYELMKRLRRDNDEQGPSDVEIAGEYLSLSGFDRRIITNKLDVTEDISLRDLWGFETDDVPDPTDPDSGATVSWQVCLKHVPTFLKHTGLTFTELLALLRTSFINPDRAIQIFPKPACQTENAKLVRPTSGGAHRPLRDEDLVRIHRFVRLWRRIGWSMEDVDKTITAWYWNEARSSEIDEKVLVRIARLRELQDKFDLPISVLRSWWGVLDTVSDSEHPEMRSQYEALFLNKSVVRPRDDDGEYAVFLLNDAGDELADTTASISEHMSTIVGALESRASDIALLVAPEGPVEDKLSLENLSILYAYVTFAKALRLSVAELLWLQELTETDPLEPPIEDGARFSRKTLHFVDVVEKIRGTEFTIAQLCYLLCHTAQTASALQPAEETIAHIFQSLKISILALQENQTLPEDPKGESTVALLQRKLPQADVDEAKKFINGTSSHNRTTRRTLIEQYFGRFVVSSEILDKCVERLVDVPESDTTELRYAYAFGVLQLSLQRRNLVIQQLGDALDLETSTAALLIDEILRHPSDDALPALDAFLQDDFVTSDEPIGRETAEDQFDIYVRLDKAARLVKGFRMADHEAKWVFHHGPNLGWIDIGTLPLASDEDAAQFAGWERLADAFVIHTALPSGEPGLFDLLSRAGDIDGGASDLEEQRVAFFETLKRITRWPVEDLLFITGSDWFDDQFPEAFQGEQVYVRLRKCFKYLLRIGIPAEQVTTWIYQEALDIAQAKEAAIAAREAIRAKNNEPGWLEVAKRLGNEIRERRRTSLVSYLLNERGYERASELYQELLIDVEMQPCMMTSRLKQALSSAQLFVQRCLMNLEDEVTLPIPDADQWQWMKNYRVWEAARKVFCTPENWIEPELLPDKSPFLEELSNELLQGEVNKETAEPAFLHYLEKLHDVARLEIMGMYHHDGESDGPDILHVIGRTIGTPHVYYYRRRIGSDSTAYWTPWEKVEVDIEGDHVLLALYNRRLHLFWAVFREKNLDQDKDPPATERAPKKIWGIQLAFSSYKNGKWSPKTITKFEYPDALSDVDYAWKLADYWLWTKVFRPVTYSFRTLFCYQKGAQTRDQNSELVLRVYGTSGVPDGGPLVLYPIFDFWVNPCGGTVSIESAEQQWSPAFAAGLTRPHGMGFRNEHEALVLQYGQFASWNSAPENGLLELSAELESRFEQIWKARRQSTVLSENTDKAFLLPPSQDRQFDSGRPFFFSDDKRCYFVSPRDHYKRLDGIQSAADAIVNGDVSWSRYAWSCNYGGISKSGARGGMEFGAIDAVVGEVTDVRRPASSTDRLLIYRGGVHDNASAEPAYSLHPFVEDEVRLAMPNFMGTGAASITGFRLGKSNRLTEKEEMAAEALVGKVDKDLIELANVSWEKYYRFDAYYHPHTCSFIRALEQRGIDALLDIAQQRLAVSSFGQYGPTEYVDNPDLIEDVDFHPRGAYAQYNWELFFHVPFLVAVRLSTNRQFEEAQKWFHYIFNPMRKSGEDGTARYWNFKPFHDAELERVRPGDESIQNLLALLQYEPDDEDKRQRKQDLETDIQRWRDDPFNPHAIARTRIVAYQKAVVMKYIDNLLAWADQLYHRFTIESINEATQIYVLARDILGKPPNQIPESQKRSAKSYDELSAEAGEAGLGAFSLGVREIENSLTADTAENTTGYSPREDLFRMGYAPYFCVPHNAKLLGNKKVLGYWKTIEDRLFKIRHCMDITGEVRQPPLFQPPIDPALLVRARAAGIDIGTAISDIHVGRPHHRFATLLRMAMEFCGDVRALGSMLQAALEKRDADSLSLLRSKQELSVLKAAREIRKQQVKQARETLEGLQKSREIVVERYRHYRDIKYTNPNEKLHLAKLTSAQIFQTIGQMFDLIANALYIVPDFDAGASGLCSPVAKARFGGSNLGAALQAYSRYFSIVAGLESHQGTIASIKGGFDRRWDDWKLQERMAQIELEQLEHQILAAEISVLMAETEQENHELQIENANETNEFMRYKFTNKDLYDWMVSQVSAVYFRMYQMAYELAKRAEKAFQFETYTPDSHYIEFGYWDNLKKGLLAGEKLQQDLRRMEFAYVDQDKRTYEITKTVSLGMLNPIALVELKRTGKCDVDLDEYLFDLDYPGHYMRRIKSLSVTLPCVTGPYTNVNCKLTLVMNKIRTGNGLFNGKYIEQAGDPRFETDFAPRQSIVTSTGQNDSGLFEVNFKDERYLPFEGAGTISSWRVELPQETNHFDIDTVSDVLIHLRYTAKEGGDLLQGKAQAEIVETYGSEDLYRLFSMRHEFATEWHRFLNPSPTSDGQLLALSLSRDLFPFSATGKTIKVKHVRLLLRLADQAKESGVIREADEHERNFLKVSLSVPSQPSKAADFEADPHLKDMPVADVDAGFDISPQEEGAAITLRVAQEDIQVLPTSLRKSVTVEDQNHYRLIPKEFEDLLMLVTYKMG